MSETGSLPRIGDPAPDFHAVTTQSGNFHFSVWQEQDWVVLFSHPADFTPVCTTELIEFAQLHERFRKKGIKLIGVSVDSIHSHLAWLENIKGKSFICDLSFYKTSGVGFLIFPVLFPLLFLPRP